MARDNRPHCSICRRKVLLGTGAAVTTGLAGCLGDDDPADDDTADDSADDAANGDDAGGDDEFEDFDLDDPVFPQTMQTLIDEGFVTGRMEDIDAFEEQDEPHYGSDIREVEGEDEIIEPSTLQFALTPTEDPALYADMVDPILENIEEETGYPCENNMVDSYAAQVEAMRADQLHIAGFSTGAVPFAVNLAGAVPFSIQVSEDDAGYRLWAITHMDHEDINSVEDFAGRNGAHGDPASNSGNLMPRALFDEEFGVEPEEDYSVEHVGDHENVILSVYHQDYEVAPVCSTCVARVAERGDVDANDIKVVWSSDPIPTTAFSYKYNLPEDVQEGIERAFLEYDYYDTEFAEEFEGRGEFIEIDYATHWHDILVTHEDNDIDLDDPADID
ncbi:phosphate/phosphite/phosphonate ABC transporter substrate-binding protein [Natrononativus amylolyticus]|uniref:phosphate/phosphite/phosphonate ABC transporter substrate-binding protein n=1 Tax=Natrononativus amylolyticus TaxID=2963434 RepID=UPI0020CB7CE9|nr:phosphate/phosphite/phosphonate ABC transporter substrate-binding protein [Natrononativus amylolyticus]